MDYDEINTFPPSCGKLTMGMIFCGISGLLAIRQSGVWRQVLIVPLLLTWFWLFSNIRGLPVNEVDVGTLAFFMLYWLQHIINVLFVQEHQLAPNTWRSAYKAMFNFRWINTHLQVVDDHSINGSSQSHQKLVNRSQFLREKASFLVTSYIFMVIYDVVLDIPDRIHISDTDLSAEKASFFRRIFTDQKMDITREFFIRAYLGFDGGLSDWFHFSWIHSLLAIICVNLLRLDDPHEWPPLFGSVSKVRNLRTYFSDFWHLLLYRTGLSYASSILKHLGVKQRNWKTRWAKNIFVFTLSGINHVVVVWAISRKLNWGFLPRWFLLPSAIFLEDLVGRLFATATFSDTEEQPREWAGIAKNLLGRVWIMLFMFSWFPRSAYVK